MKKFNEEKFNQDWITFLGYMEKAGVSANFDLDALREQFKNGAAAITEESGVAYPGALLSHLNIVTALSMRMFKNVSSTFSEIGPSLLKVCVLHQLAKLEMYIPNDNDWEVSKRGFNYKFQDTEGCLRIGERSLMLAYDHGIRFSGEEWEAMRCLDRTPEELNSAKSHLGIISVIIRSANDLAYTLEREQWARTKNI